MPSHPLCDWFGEEEFQDGFFEFKKGMRMLIYTDGVDNIHSDPKVKDRLFELLGKKEFSSRQFISEVREELHSLSLIHI